MSEGTAQNDPAANRINSRGSSSYNQQTADDPGYRPKVVVQVSTKGNGSSQQLRESDDDPTASSPFPISSKPIGIFATRNSPHALDEMFKFV
jgi:hypothetical protein